MNCLANSGGRKGSWKSRTINLSPIYSHLPEDLGCQSLPSPPHPAEDPPCPPAKNAGQAYPREGALGVVIASLPGHQVGEARQSATYNEQCLCSMFESWKLPKKSFRMNMRNRRFTNTRKINAAWAKSRKRLWPNMCDFSIAWKRAHVEVTSVSGWACLPSDKPVYRP